MEKPNAKSSVDRLLLVGALLGLAGPLQAHQVWTSTCKTPQQVLDAPGKGSLLAANLQGLNSNFAPGSGADKPSTDQWKQILADYTIAHQHTCQPWGHPDDNVGFVTVTVAQKTFTNNLNQGTDWGFNTEYFMLYDKGGTDGKINAWTEAEVNNCRTALNNIGRSDIKLIYNARSYGNKDKINWANINEGLNEGSTDYWMSNKAGRQELLKWVAVKNQQLVRLRIQ